MGYWRRWVNILIVLVVVSVIATVLAARLFLVNPILQEMRELRVALEPSGGSSAIGFMPAPSGEGDEDVEEEEPDAAVDPAAYRAPQRATPTPQK